MSPEVFVGRPWHRLFQNFGKTQRTGWDANLDGRIGRITWGLDYTFLDATYHSQEVLDGSLRDEDQGEHDEKLALAVSFEAGRPERDRRAIHQALRREWRQLTWQI